MAIVPVDTDPTATNAGELTGAAVTLGPFQVFANNSSVKTTRGMTCYVICGGTAYSTVVLSGSFDGTNWVTAKDIAWANASIAATGTTHLVLGASYPYLKCVTTGGDGTSTLKCKLID